MTITDEVSDDQLIARARWREKRRRLGALAGFVLTVLVAQGVIFQPAEAFGGWKIGVVMAVLAAGLSVIFLVLRLTHRPGDPRVQAALLRLPGQERRKGGTKTVDDLTDDQLFAILMGNDKRMALWSLALAAVALIAFLAIDALPATLVGGRSHVVVCELLILVVAMVLAEVIGGRRDPRLLAAMLRRVDVLQRKRSQFLLVYSAIGVAISPFVWRAAGEWVAGGEHHRVVTLLGWMTGLGLTAIVRVLNPFRRKARAVLLNDEFSRTLRARAVSTGLAVLCLGAVGLFMLGVERPALAVQAIPVLLLYTAIITSVAYAAMDLWADRT